MKGGEALKRYLLLGTLILALILLGGCSGVNKTGTGELALFLADTPVNDVAHVWVTLERVDVIREDAAVETINEFDVANGEGKFDLLQLRFDEELLGQKTLPAGTYNQIRLIVAADNDNYEYPEKSGMSYIVFTDGREDADIFIPSGKETGLKINHKFVIEDGEIKRLILDNDISKLLKQAGGSGLIILEPTAIKVVDQLISGSVWGRVLNDQNQVITDVNVYIKAIDPGTGEYVTDVNGEVIQTIASAKPVGEVEAGSFKLRGLMEGTYHIEISAEGYETALINDVKIFAGMDTKLKDYISGETVILSPQAQ